MSIEGVKFCDVCGGAIGVDDIAPVRVDEDGHLVQLHLHNRRRDDCLAQKLLQLAEQYASGTAAAVSDGSAQEPAQQEA
jgi:hypothetical protein